MYDKFHGDANMDQWIASNFQKNGELIKGGVMIDIGAYHPTYLNNSYYFERNDWKVLCIEPNPYMIQELKKERKNVIQLACSNVNEDDCDFSVVKGPWDEKGMAGATGFHVWEEPRLSNETHKLASNIEKIKVAKRTLNHILEEQKISHIDAVSIDVESHERQILEGFDLEKYSPKVLVIENYHEEQWMRDYMKERGYEFKNRMHVDDCYVLLK